MTEQRTSDREVAWVLIKDPLPGGGLRYLRVNPIGHFDWTENHLDALRLSRRQDADALAAVIDDADRVEEHMWVTP